MSADFGYINARVRGMKARLLGPEFYNEALGASDYRAFLTSLSQSAYMREVEEAQARQEGLRVADTAIALNFYRTTRSILNFSDGTPHVMIALILLRYDLANLKAIVRAKHAGRAPEEIQQALFPAGELRPAVLEQLAAAPDIPAVAQALAITRHPLAPVFTRAASQYTSDGDLYRLELFLDRAYYQVILDALEQHDLPDAFVRHIWREIDATNLRTALKLRGATSGNAASATAASLDDFFIPGGREINRARFEMLVTSEGEAGLQDLTNTAFADVVNAGTASGAEAAIRTALDRSARRLALADPLGIGVVLEYLREKEAETARLRLLARGKFYGVPRPQLERELGHA